MAGSVKSGVLEFSDEQKVFVAVDEDDVVKKAVLIDREGNETALGALPTDEQVQEAVDAWLDDHPEATTTVEDGSLTLPKFKDGELPFVTPEQFGAKGDGITDDTTAWQNAVNSGYNVRATKKNYKCNQINVTKDIIIDCNWAQFTCGSDKLFYCSGDITKPLANEADYIADTPYQLSEDYTGIAFLLSEDNVIKNRNYYYGGFVGKFVDGICIDNRPIGFTGVSVNEISPITCIIENVGNVTHPNSPNANYTIYCLYGYMCHFRNIKQVGEKYNIVLLEKCLECELSYISANISYTGAWSYYYGIDIVDSSNIYTHDCDIASDWWHCWTTGGNYFCYDNIVERCIFKISDGGVALCDHDNGIGTKVYDCDLSQCYLFGDSVIKNSRIYACHTGKNASAYSCQLAFCTTNIDGTNHFHAENIKFIASSSTDPNASGRYGIIISINSTTQTQYINGVLIKDIYGDYITGDFTAPFLSSNQTLTIKGQIVLDNVLGRYRVLGNNHTYDSKCVLIVKNCIERGAEGFLLGAISTQEFPPLVMVNDSILHIKGTFTKLILNNVHKKASQTVLGAEISGTRIEGNNIDKIANAYLLNFTNVDITNMKYSDSYTWAYVVKNATVGAYYGQIEATGIVPYALT